MPEDRSPTWEVVAGPIWRRPFGRSLKSLQFSGSGEPMKLMKAESKLVDAILNKRHNEWCKFGPAPNGPTADNTIRADFLRFLALGGDDELALFDQGLRLEGVFIDGALTFEGCRAVAPLAFKNSTLADISFDTTTLNGLNFSAVRFGMLRIRTSTVQGDISFTDHCRSIGAIEIGLSKVRGDIAMRGVAQANEVASGLTIEDCTIRGSVAVGSGFATRGVTLKRNNVGGDLIFEGELGTGSNEPCAVYCSHTRARGSLIYSCANSKPVQVRVNQCRIKGDFRLVRGLLSSSGSSAFQGRGTRRISDPALVIAGTKIGGDLMLGEPSTELGALVIDGAIDLRMTRCRGAYYDRPELWPKPNRLLPDVSENVWHLDGFEYNRPHAAAPFDIATRSAWLKRQPSAPNALGVARQPFVELEKHYLALGRPGDVLALARLKRNIRRRWRTTIAPWWRKPFAWLAPVRRSDL